MGEVDGGWRGMGGEPVICNKKCIINAYAAFPYTMW